MSSLDVEKGADVGPKPTAPNLIRLPGTVAKIVPVKLTGNELIPPADPKVLGWWGEKAGASQGTTLLLGHTVHRAAWHIYGHGKLDDLETYSVGDKLAIYSQSNDTPLQRIYQVVSNRVISKAELAKQAPRLFSQTGLPKLVIVTCQNYHRATQSYSSNVVLVAKQV